MPKLNLLLMIPHNPARNSSLMLLVFKIGIRYIIILIIIVDWWLKRLIRL